MRKNHVILQTQGADAVPNYKKNEQANNNMGCTLPQTSPN